MSDEALKQIAALAKRVEALETALVDLLAENHHQLVGGKAFALDSIRAINEARNA